MPTQNVSTEVASRFDNYLQRLCPVLGHADRERPFQGYCKGLVAPIRRKSVEPMATMVAPDKVGAVHQSLHHFVAKAGWKDEAMLEAVQDLVAPSILPRSRVLCWPIQQQGFAKKGRFSVGVARQHWGDNGRRENCQIAVIASMAGDSGSMPLGFRLYLPREWHQDPGRMRRAGVPAETRYASQTELALGLVDYMVQRGIPDAPITGGAWLGGERGFRQSLSRRGMQYLLGAAPQTGVRTGAYEVPSTLAALVRELRDEDYRSPAGTGGRERAAYAVLEDVKLGGAEERETVTLISERRGEIRRLWISNIQSRSSLEAIHSMVEATDQSGRDQEFMRSALGLGDFEGRGWRGFHHHLTLCMTVFGFLRIQPDQMQALPRLQTALFGPEEQTRGRMPPEVTR